MLRYQNNAFRVLGLKPNVSMQEIMQRINEFKVKKSLDMDVVYEYDFPWMGPLDRSEQNVLNALQRLGNPVSRLREEIFWFWFENDCDTRAINCLLQNNHKGAHNAWEVLITEEGPTKESISAFINQIILAHSSVIGEECMVRYEDETKKQKKKNITFDEKHWQNWKFVISRFTLIASNKVFWEMVKNKAEKIEDPRLSSSKVDEIRNNFLQDIAEPNFIFMSDALISKDYERVKQHSSLLKEDWIPNESSLPSEVLRKGFNRILASQTDLLNRHAQNAAKELKKVEEGEKDADKVVIDIYSKLNNKVTDIIYEGNLVDINNISDFALAKDKVAEVIRNCAIELNNNLNSNTDLSKQEIASELFQANVHLLSLSSYIQAYEMIRKAVEYASTTYTKQKYEKDEKVIKKNLEMAGGSSEFADTIYTKQKYEKYEKDEKVIKKNLEKAGKSSGINWVAILSYLCLGAIILFFFIIPIIYNIIIPMFNDISTNNKTTTSTSLPTKTWDWVPPISTSSEETYVVEVGDSLGKIAQKFGTTIESIIARNKLANPNLIRPGQKLIIPTE